MYSFFDIARIGLICDVEPMRPTAETRRTGKGKLRYGM